MRGQFLPRLSLALLALITGLIFTAPAHAAVDMFIKIEGVDGESTDSGHRDEIDVLAWSWGMTRGGAAKGASRRPPGTELSDLSLTKYLDKATPGLLQACANGKVLPKATLTVRKAGSRGLEYLVIELTGVMVTAVDTGGSGGDDRLTEEIRLNFTEIKMTYTPQRADGSPGAAQEFGWNVREGRSTTATPTRAR